MSPGVNQSVKDFIDDIPDEKLTGLPLQHDKLYRTKDYSLVMQSVV